MTLANIQGEQKAWVAYNFPDSRPLWVSALGVSEEAGELCHAVLKQSQDIRGSKEGHDDEILDAIGDITIYLMDLCNKLGWNFEAVVEQTWKQVKQRDWQKFPTNGRTE